MKEDYSLTLISLNTDVDKKFKRKTYQLYCITVRISYFYFYASSSYYYNSFLYHILLCKLQSSIIFLYLHFSLLYVHLSPVYTPNSTYRTITSCFLSKLYYFYHLSRFGSRIGVNFKLFLRKINRFKWYDLDLKTKKKLIV